jgi:alcohol dehydrogenase (cytochrome c)
LFASGVLFVCSDGGTPMAVDSLNGKILWQFDTSAAFKASPVTYEFDGKQYIAIASGQNIIAFGVNQ